MDDKSFYDKIDVEHISRMRFWEGFLIGWTTLLSLVGVVGYWLLS